MSASVSIIHKGHYWVKTEASEPFIAQAHIVLNCLIWLVSGTDMPHPNVVDPEKVSVLREVDPFVRIPTPQHEEHITQAIRETVGSATNSLSFVAVVNHCRALSGDSLKDSVIKLLEYLIFQAEQCNSAQAFALLRDHFQQYDDVVKEAKQKLVRLQSS